MGDYCERCATAMPGALGWHAPNGDLLCLKCMADAYGLTRDDSADCYQQAVEEIKELSSRCASQSAVIDAWERSGRVLRAELGALQERCEKLEAANDELRRMYDSAVKE